MGLETALLAMSVAQGYGQYEAGQIQKAESKANADIIEDQMKTIQMQADIDYGQYQTLKGKTLASSTATAAKMGVELSGSPSLLAKMINVQKEIGIDQIVRKYKYTTDINNTKAKADMERRRGKMAAYEGMLKGFGTIAQGAANYAFYKGWGSTPTKSINTESGAGQAFARPSMYGQIR